MSTGVRLGSVVRRSNVYCPWAEYRVWVVGELGMSLPHPVNLESSGSIVDVDLALEACVQLDPVLALRDACMKQWKSHSESLSKRLGVEVVTVTAPSVASASAPHVSVQAAPIFSPWYLLPFGIGQLAQDRPVHAGIYAAVQGSMLAWHWYAYGEHKNAVDRNRYELEPAKRSRRNLSAALLYGTLVLSVAEAVTYGLLQAD